MTVGDVSVGVEVVIYFDPEICNGENFSVVAYTYSGASISSAEIEALVAPLVKEATFAITELGDQGADTMLLAMKSVFEKMQLSGGVFLIDANEKFDKYSSYSGLFTTYSGTIDIKNVSVTGFRSSCDTCVSYGVKVGGKMGISKVSSFWPFAFSYSRTYYSDPIVLWEGGLK